MPTSGMLWPTGRVPRPVVVVGDVGIDVLTRAQMPVVQGGEATSRISLVPGGAGGNTAAWLAAHAVDVSLLARIGNDQAGVTARGALESAGVRCVFSVDDVLPRVSSSSSWTRPVSARCSPTAVPTRRFAPRA